MIHHTPDGTSIKLGLNFNRAPGGFKLMWAWYDFATTTASIYRLRIRLHKAPRILWNVRRFNVVDNYLIMNGLELVNSEVLQDLKATEDSMKRTNEPYAYINSQAV